MTFSFCIQKTCMNMDRKSYGDLVHNRVSSIRSQKGSEFQPGMFETLSCCGPPLWQEVQHLQKEIREKRRLSQEKVVFLHQHFIQPPWTEDNNSPQVTCATTNTSEQFGNKHTNHSCIKLMNLTNCHTKITWERLIQCLLTLAVEILIGIFPRQSH